MWNEEAVVKHMRHVYKPWANSLPGPLGDQQEEAYNFINNDFDLSSRLDDRARIIGSPAVGGALFTQYIRNPVCIVSIAVIALYAVYSHRHVLCRVVLAMTGGIIGSPHMSATRKTSCDHKDIV